MNDLTGRTFGRWYVLSRADDHVTKKGYHHIMWNCICECGTRRAVRGKSLTGGISTSCGCKQKELIGKRASKHNGYGTRLYNIWNSMRQRCNNPKHASYHNYGGRGISICEEWNDFAAFRNWAYDNGYRDNAARGELTLDRADVNKGYSPSNCRFVDMRRQADNRRQSIILEHEGKRLPLTEWANILNVKYPTLWKRYKNGVDIFADI